MPDKNPVSDAILKVIGEYRSLTDESRRKKVETVSVKRKSKSNQYQQFLNEKRFTPPRSRRVINDT